MLGVGLGRLLSYWAVQLNVKVY